MTARFSVPSGSGSWGVVALVILTTSCVGDSHQVSASGHAAAPARTATTSPYRAGQPCPVTIANGSTPSGVSDSGVNHGNGKLWVSLYPNGRVMVYADDVLVDGSISKKFGWWRGVRGQLVITGQRLDAAAPPTRSDIPSGYGDEFFQASGIIFPTPGCWKITGSVGGATISFVTEVVRA